MAQTLEPKITLCPDCKLRLEGYQADIAAWRISQKEALHNAVRDCDTDEYTCFYPLGFSKHGVVFIAEEEIARRKAMRRAQEQGTGSDLGTRVSANRTGRSAKCLAERGAGLHPLACRPH